MPTSSDLDGEQRAQTAPLDLNLLSSGERRVAARAQLWAGVASDVGKAVGILIWVVYLFVALISGQPIVSF